MKMTKPKREDHICLIISIRQKKLKRYKVHKV